MALRIPRTFLKDPEKLESYVHKHIFPRISAFERHYLTQYFTTLLNDGWESGDESAWGGSDGTSSASATAKRTGNYGLLCNLASAANNGWAGDYINVSSLGATVYIRAYVNFQNPPNTDNEDQFALFFGAGTAANAVAYAGIRRVSGVLYWTLYLIESGTTLTYRVSATVYASGWHCLELGVYSNNSGWTRLWLDGSLILDRTGIDNNGRALTYGRAGFSYSDAPSAAQANLWVDDCKIADAYIGPESELISKAFTDTVGAMDAFVNPYRVMGFSTSISTSDAWATPFRALSFVDSVSIADLFAVLQRFLSFSDAVSFADVFSKAVVESVTEKGFADFISMSEAFAIVLKILPFAESVHLTDAFATPYREMLFSDSVAVADTFALVLKLLGFADSVSVSEAFQIALRAFNFTESVSVSDDYATPYRAVTFADSISTADAFGIVLRALGFSDAVSVADVFGVIIGLVGKSFSDSIGVSDAFSTVLRLMSFADGVDVEDNFSIVFKTLAFSDVVSFLDVFALLGAVSFSVLQQPFRQVQIREESVARINIREEPVVRINITEEVID